MLKYDPTTLILYQMMAAVNILAALALSLLLALSLWGLYAPLQYTIPLHSFIIFEYVF